MQVTTPEMSLSKLPLVQIPSSPYHLSIDAAVAPGDRYARVFNYELLSPLITSHIHIYTTPKLCSTVPTPLERSIPKLPADCSSNTVN